MRERECSNPPSFPNSQPAITSNRLRVGDHHVYYDKKMPDIKFDEEDWQDRQYESSAPALERGRHARAQYLRGEYKTFEEVKGQPKRKQPTEA
jgi:hypothetical protein